MMNKNAKWFHSMRIPTDPFRTTHNWARNEISWWGYICHLYQIRFQVKERMECNNHYRNCLHWIEKQFKKELKKLQLGVNNTRKHVQIAKDIGKSPPYNSTKKQLLHEVETALIIFSTCCIGWSFLTLFTKKDYKKSPYPE